MLLLVLLRAGSVCAGRGQEQQEALSHQELGQQIEPFFPFFGWGWLWELNSGPIYAEVLYQ